MSERALIQAISDFRKSRYPRVGKETKILPEKISRNLLLQLCSELSIGLPDSLQDFRDGDELAAHGTTLKMFRNRWVTL